MLWPVFPAATRKIDNLFARNERLVFELETERFGTIAEVMVGAFGVGRMSTLLDPIITNTGGAEVALKPQATVERAGEIGRFEMGSTVILCLEPGRIEWTIKPGQPVRLGRPIARRRVAG
jgi:phosphatidylserine decarboxylase